MSVPTVLVLPFPGQGHVNPMMSLSQKLIEHGCRVIFVNTDFNHKRVVSSIMVDEQQQYKLDDDESLMKLVSVPDGLGPDDDRKEPGKQYDAVVRTMPRMLEKLIEDTHHGDGDNRIGFIVADLEVGSKFGIKGAAFCPIAATMFALLCNSPKLIDDGIINSDGLLLTTKNRIRLSPKICQRWTQEPFFG
ncbi:UDP-glycosyltransferase 83A1 [Glycine max]|nr:UDP-glycosyltransferase 83A1 [Glycine max]